MFLLVFSISATAWSQSCNENNLLEYIELEDQGFQHPINIMEPHEAQELMCTNDPYDPVTFDDARSRMRMQIDLLEAYCEKGYLSKGGCRYYRGVYNEWLENISLCEQKAEQNRANTVQYPWKDTSVLIRSDDLIDLVIWDEDGNIKRRIGTHKVWLGRLFNDEGVALCEAELYFN